MKIFVTDALVIDLATERWHCARCQQDLADARGSYKKGLLVRERRPSDIHAPIIDPQRYEFTFAPDPDWCAILEYCCPCCGHLMEVEYLPPGHPPTNDMEFDIDALKAQWAKRTPLDGPSIGPDFTPPPHHHH